MTNYNTIHRTASGTAQAIAEWRDGAAPKARAGIACLTVHDDVTNAVWRYTGDTRDAAETIGQLYVGTRNKVARLNGAHIEIETSDQFWNPPLHIGKGEPDEDGDYSEFEFNAAAYPDIMAW